MTKLAKTKPDNVLVRPTDGLVELWLRSKTGATLKAYRRDLEDFAAFVGAASVDEALGLMLNAPGGGPATRVLLEYRADLTSRPVWRSAKARARGDEPYRHGFAPATVNRRLAALKSVLDLASVLGLVDWRVSIEWMRVKPYRDVRGPNVDDFVKLQTWLKARVEQPDPKPAAVRDWCLWVLLSQHGLRRSEALALRWPDDIEYGAKPSLWLVEKGDGGSRLERTQFPLSQSGVAAIDAWIAVRGDKPGPLILGVSNNASPRGLSERKVNELLGEWSVQAGCERSLRPHGLRHRAITELLERTNGNVTEVQRFSRHRKLDTLVRYNDRRLEQPRDLVAMLDE